MAGPKNFLSGFVKSTAGNVLPMAAIGIIVSAALVGGGIDMSRAYRVENRLQAACDAAVLAGRKNVGSNGFDTNAENQADAYFATNFDETAQEAHDTDFEASSTDNGNTVNGVASTTLDSAVMRIFGFNEFNLGVNCSASMGVGNSDVVMVLDTTGSMAQEADGSSVGWGETSKLEDLQEAMKNFYDTLEAAVGSSNTRVRYGFVPYSSSINVGQLIYDLDPNYLVDTHDIQSRQAVFVEWNGGTSHSGSWYGNWSNWSGWDYGGSCPSTGSWSDYGSPSTNTSGGTITQEQTQRRRVYDCDYYYSWQRDRYRYEYRNAITEGTTNTVGNGTFDHWEYKQITYPMSLYKTFAQTSTLTGWNGSVETSTWDGCIEERGTVSEASFSYSTLLGITPSGAYDLDIDSPPDLADDATKWAPMWPEVAYYRKNSYGNWTSAATSDDGSQVSSNCPYQAQLLTEMTESEFDAYADSLTAQGNTYHDLGLIWGARISSPDGIFSDNVNLDPANGGEVSRHIIFMTDGIMQPNNKIQSSYGIEYYDKRVTDDGSSNDDNRHSSRFLALCAAVKAKGIRLWVIAFGTSLTTNLQTCSSDSSSFTASSATQLNTAFQEIANQVGELRIIQ